jgi:hypothetical protein
MASVGQKSRNPAQEPDKEPLAKDGHLSKRPFTNTLLIWKNLDPKRHYARAEFSSVTAFRRPDPPAARRFWWMPLGVPFPCCRQLGLSWLRVVLSARGIL